jgi:hypothetical protein
LTEAIHFGNDFHPSVASLGLLDAFRRNRWSLSVGITGGIRRNTQSSDGRGNIARFPLRKESWPWNGPLPRSSEKLVKPSSPLNCYGRGINVAYPAFDGSVDLLA